MLFLAASFKQTPEKQEQPHSGFTVEYISVSPVQKQITVHATGTVQANQMVSVIPQVSGHVIQLAPGFVSGGFFKQGDMLFEIDPQDYKLAAEQSRAKVARAEYEMAQIESQARIAKLEWERMKLASKKSPSALLLYKPQLKNAKAALSSAKADLAGRLLNIERTLITAPFDCLIQTESVDLGQFISAGTAVGQVVGTVEAEIHVPVSFDDLIWLDVPRQNSGNAAGSPATVRLTAGSRTYVWQGRIDRMLGGVDPQGRMARIAVRVKDPYNLADRHDRPAIDLSIGIFVNVSLEGKTIPEVFAIPSNALRENQTVWIMDRNSRLEVRPVRILHKERESVLIDEGLSPGDRVILTQVPGAAPHMQLKGRNGKDIQ